jgi:hypothetical protein
MIETEVPRLLVGLRIMIRRDASGVPLTVAFDVYGPFILDSCCPLLHFFGAAPGPIEVVVVHI